MVPVLGTPWVITPSWMRVVIAIASRGKYFDDARLKALEARGGAPLKNARLATVRDGVAIIPVQGPLIRHASVFDDLSGATSYGAIRKDLQVALDDSNVRAILFSFGSPGGEVAGCSELADAIYGARAQKPITAYVDAMCCSGAYWLASACDEVVSAETGELGSIGVVLGWLDDSQALENAGVEEVQFVSSVSPNKRPDHHTDEGKAQYQQIVDDLAQVFVAKVARGRGVAADEVAARFGAGGISVGARAVDAGLADRLGDFESLLAELASADPNQNRAGALVRAARESRTMTVKSSTTSNAEPTATAGSQMCDSCGKAMAPNAKSYCSGCYADAGDGDPDDDEDEEDASALGIDPKASRAERLARARQLAALEGALLQATGCKTGELALAEVSRARSGLATAESKVRGAALRASLVEGLDQKRLSLGAIQKQVPHVLRGEKKAAWQAAMGKLKAVTRDAVLDAAASVDLGSEDVEAISGFCAAQPPIAAATFEEPPRSPDAEATELDETARIIKAAADKARSTLDRGKKAAATK